jgi:uncharacterized protein (DUF1800 family)
MQDGIDLVNALASNPNTARYIATKLYRFFVTEFGAVNVTFVNRVAGVFQQTSGDMRAVMREVLLSPEFWDQSAYWTRYAWPVEFVVRAWKDVGWNGFSVNDALTPLANMGQTLFEPPDVSGWRQGGAWFSSGATLARMNFASALASNQKFNLLTKARPHGQTPENLLAFFLDELATAPMDSSVSNELLNYLHTNGAWTGSDTQIQNKSAGLVHLIGGAPEYQLT